MFDLHRLTTGELHRFTRWLVKSPFNQHVSPPKKNTQTSPSPGSLHLFRPGGPEGRRLPELPFRDSPLDSDPMEISPHGSMADLPTKGIWHKIPGQSMGHIRTTCTFWVSDSARPLPGRKFRTKWNGNIRNQWLIGKSLPEAARSTELLKLWGASTNEQMLVETRVKWHEIIHAELNEWTNEPLTHVS